ncbi:MAG TPA: hypothetical protein PKM16_07110, partial [Bacteroidia bacterium]|nr:hypothetical protein [Bacteroidia bacterium]
MGRIFYVLLLFSISIFSCKKESEIIKGNQAPFDGTISNEYREDFIRKSYLYLIGKAPSAIELDSGMMILRKNNCSVNNREEFLDGLFNQEVYRLKLYSDITSAFLNNISDNTIDQYLIFIQDELNKPSNLPNYGILLKELEAMQKLDSLKNKFRNSLVGTVEAHKITVNTIAYEDIVGKGEAWAIGLFADFLNRQPTLSEIENIDDMLGNQTGTLFNSEGDSKEDIIEILFSSN